VEYRTLGRTGLKVSSIGLGCVTFGREIDRRTSFDVLDRAIDRGVNLLDTAAAYGSGASEMVLGRWMTERGMRDRIVLATKVSGLLSSKAIRESVEGSLRRLQTDRIDLLQMHTWDEHTPLEETLEALNGLITSGKACYGGCSNWTAGQVRTALVAADTRGWHRLESLQPIYNLVDRRIEQEMLPLCAEQELGLLTYSPLGAGFLTGKYLPGGNVPKGTRFDVIPGHQRIYFTDHGFQVVERLRRIAKQTGHSMPRLALSWVFGRPGVTSVLIGARHPDHVDQAFQAERGRLPAELVNQLDRL